MINHKKTPLIAYSIIILIWLYTFYVSVLNPPFLGYFTFDENFIADSGVFLWYGNTPRCLDWPATPSVIVFFLMFGIVLIYSTLSDPENVNSVIDIFEGIDVEAYRYITSRQELILIGRTIQLLVVGLILVLIVKFIFTKQHHLLSSLSRNILVFLIITSYIVWFNAPVLRPEAISCSLFIYLMVRLFFSDTINTRECYLFALLFGIILAERLLFVFVTPILLGGVYYKIESNRLRYTIRFFIIALLTFILLCPFLITDPLVVLKSFFGGILAKMQDKPMPTFFNVDYIKGYFDTPINYLIVLLTLVGILVLVKQKKIFYYIVIANWILFLIMVFKSAKIYDTHVLPAGILTMLVSGLGISFLAQKVKIRPLLIAGILVLLIVGYNLYQYVGFQQRSHVISNFSKAFSWIKTLPENSRLLVHPELEFYLPKSNETLTWMLEQNRDSLKMVRKLNYLMGTKGDKAVQAESLPFVARSFAFEDERLYDIQYQLLLKYNSRSQQKRFTYDVYLDNVELASLSIRTDIAIEDFRRGKYDYMITDIPMEGFEPIQVFSNNMHPAVFCYKSKNVQ